MLNKNNQVETFLDSTILDTFHKTFENFEPFRVSDVYYKKFYNLFCVITQRLESCIKFFKTHWNYPKTEEELVCFITFIDILFEAIKNIFISLDLNINDFQESICFSEVIIDSLKIKGMKHGKNDGQIFKYVRALALAHSFNTSQQSNFLLKDEVQYSPFVFVDFNHKENNNVNVGVMVYSNLEKGMFSITFPFSNLKQFCINTFNLLSIATKEIEAIISKTQKSWLDNKVDRSLPTLLLLNNIIDILNNRYTPSKINEIKQLILLLETIPINKKNVEPTEKLKNAIIAKLPQLCDEIDNLNIYEKSIMDFIYVRPKRMHSSATYQLEKIFCGLYEDNDSVEIKYSLTQAKSFFNGFAKRWIYYNEEFKNFNEIHLLVHTALYLELEREKLNSSQKAK